MGISIRYILTLAAALSISCGPAFEAYNYGVDAGSSLGGSGPIVSDPVLPPNTNVVRNPSFDQEFTTWEDWGGASLLTTGAYSGGRALRISGSGVGGLGQEIIYRLKTGATYQLTAQAKVASLADEVYIGVRFFDLTNGTISDQRVRIQSTTYKPHTVQITPPKSASSAKVYAWKQSLPVSFADVDDYSLVMTNPPVDPPKKPALANPNNYRPSGPSGAYSLVLDESFAGSSLNTSVWNTGLWFNTTINGELQAYRPENARVGGGKLSLVAEFRESQTAWGEPMNYSSGAITTRNKFTFTFGVIEARLKLPKGQGLSSLFQIEPNLKRSPPSITAMHGLGQNSGEAKFSYKFYDINGIVRALTGSVNGVDFSSDYHTFTVEWTATAIRFYVDGQLKGAYTGDSILRDEAFIVLSLAVGGSTVGNPSGVAWPQAFDVDYVRVWQ